MARLSRLVVPGLTHWVRQYAIAERALFTDSLESAYFVDLLRQGAREFGLEVYAYGLQSNYFEVLCGPQTPDSLAKTLQWLGRRYVAWYNRRYQRTGALWQGRYRSVVLEPGMWPLVAMMAMETGAAEPLGSSQAHHLGLQAQNWLVDPAEFWALGNTPYERQAAYQTLIDEGLDRSQKSALDQAIVSGWPLGSSRWLNELATVTGRRVRPVARGRPKTTTLSPNNLDQLLNKK